MYIFPEPSTKYVFNLKHFPQQNPMFAGGLTRGGQLLAYLREAVVNPSLTIRKGNLHQVQLVTSFSCL